MSKKKKERRFEMAHLAIGLGGILVGIFTTILTIKSSEKKQEIYKGISQVGTFDYVSYQFPSLNPGQSVGIDEPIFIFVTTIRGLIEMDESLLACEATYLFKLAMTLSGTDIPSQDFAVSLMTIRCADINELRDKFQEYVDEQARQIRRRTSLWSYLALLVQDNFKLALLVYPAMDTKKN
jgi:hypothetical protein